MSDATGKGAHTFHFLGMQELLFQSLPLRDIEPESFHAEPPLVMPVLSGEEHVAPVQ